jgi:serine/threonine protein kinase
MNKILEALNYMHSKGVFHNGLKPSDIIIDRNLNPKIIDFGIIPKEVGLSPISDIQKDYFMPPEIKDGKPASEKSDVWSLGVILYIMLVGRYPFSDETKTFNKTLWKNVSEEAQDLITSMLQTNPVDRPTANKCLDHPWIVKGTDLNDEEVVEHFDESEFGESIFGSYSSNSELRWTMNTGIKRINSEPKVHKEFDFE